MANITEYLRHQAAIEEVRKFMVLPRASGVTKPKMLRVKFQKAGEPVEQPLSLELT